MKTQKVGLQTDVVTPYDETKTYVAGRARQYTLDGAEVIAPPLTTFADVNTSFGVAPGHCMANATTGRKFELSNTTTNTPTVLLFNFNIATGIWSYVGKVILTLPSGTHTHRGLHFDDSNASNIKIMITSTVATTTCLGGVYITWGLTLADFTPSGTTIFMGSSPTAGTKGVYFSQYASQVGQLHTGTTSGGIASGVNAATVGNRTKYFMQNGTSAAMQIYGFDSTLGSPAIAGLVHDGVSCQTTAYAGTSPSAYFSMSAQNGYSTAANTAAAFEATIVQNGSGSVPANFTSTTSGGAQTVYFMRDLQNVSGTWYFNLSTTSTGTAVVPTSTTSNFTMMRAYGISTTHSLLKTGTITPALTGTLIILHSFGACTPASVPANPALNGVDCLFLTTSSNLYLGAIADLVDGSANWSSISGVNLLGTSVDTVAPTAIYARYSTTLDKWIYVSNVSRFLIKSHINNTIDKTFAAPVTGYYEAQNTVTVQPGLSTIVSFSEADGWVFIVGSTVGQRGVVAMDLRSDEMFDYSYLITPVMEVDKSSIINTVSTYEKLYEQTDDSDFYIRSANTSTDAIFNSPTGGWTYVSNGENNSPTAMGPFFQIKALWNMAVEDLKAPISPGTPAQLEEILVHYTAPGEISSHWRASKNLSTDSTTVFYLKNAYSSAVPQLFARAHNLSNTLAYDINSVDDTAQFKYSTDAGVTWTALGTIPNAVGTLVQVTWSPTPTFTIQPSLSEE